MSIDANALPGRTKGDRTKRRILEAALELFTERGFNMTSVRDIAARAEITHAGLLHHYPTKDEMLVQILAFREHRETEDFFAHDDPNDPDRLFKWMLDIVRNNAAHPDRVQLFVRLTAEATDPEHPARAYFDRRYARLHMVLTAHFATHFALTPPPFDITPDEASRTTIAFLDGLQIQWLLMPDELNMPALVLSHLRRLGVTLPESA